MGQEESMFKFFLRWIDSWSTTQTSETNESDTFKIYKDNANLNF